MAIIPVYFKTKESFSAEAQGMSLFDPDTLHGRVGFFLRFSAVLTSVKGLNDLQTRILLITYDRDRLSIKEVHRILGEWFSLNVSYHTVRNTVSALRRKGLIALKQELQMRGRPSLISLEPEGHQVLAAVLAQAEAMLGVIPHEDRSMIKTACQRAVEILDQLECLRLLAEQNVQEGSPSVDLAHLIRARIIELCH
jgi:transposase